jgi:hypothetical protein
MHNFRTSSVIFSIVKQNSFLLYRCVYSFKILITYFLVGIQMSFFLFLGIIYTLAMSATASAVLHIFLCICSGRPQDCNALLATSICTAAFVFGIFCGHVSHSSMVAVSFGITYNIAHIVYKTMENLSWILFLFSGDLL